MKKPPVKTLIIGIGLVAYVLTQAADDVDSQDYCIVGIFFWFNLGEFA
jgi:hypothetical protein